MSQQLFDPGLQPERTELAWRRATLALIVGALVALRLLPPALGSWSIIVGLAGLVLAAIIPPTSAPHQPSSAPRARRVARSGPPPSPRHRHRGWSCPRTGVRHTPLNEPDWFSLAAFQLTHLLLGPPPSTKAPKRQVRSLHMKAVGPADNRDTLTIANGPC